VAINLMLHERGLRSIEADEIKGMIGDGVPKLVERALVAAAGDVEQKNALVERFLEIYGAKAAILTRCYPGVVETLALLRSRHFRLAVVTNKPVIASLNILRALSLADFFSVVIGGDSLPQRKPDPAPLLEAARKFGLGVDQLLMVGDNIHDVEAARAAGMRCVAVSYGYHHRPPAEFHADHLIDRFDELLALVIGPPHHRNNKSGGTDSDHSVHSIFSLPELRP
jgi:phosphoglycolate phosphatase